MENIHTHTGDHNHEHNSTSHEHHHVPAKDKNIAFGVLAYLGPLLIISYLVARDDAFVRFHIRQGLVILTIDIVMWVLGMTLWILFPLISLINIAMLVFAVLGIINVIQGKERELPFIGKYSSYFKL